MRRNGYRLWELPGYALLLVVPPVALVRLVGWAGPRGMPTQAQVQAWLREPLTWHTIVVTATVAGWAVWGIYAATVAAETYRWLNHWVTARWRLPRLSMPRPVQAMTAAVLGATAVSATSDAALAAIGPAGATAALPDKPHADDRYLTTAATVSGRASGAPQPVPGARTTGRTPTHPAVRGTDTEKDPAFTPTAGANAPARTPALRRPAKTESGPQYTVKAGDTLWEIAQACLGDPRRWPEIYHLNQARYDQNGRMRGGHLIHPGQRLGLPADARPPTGARGPGSDAPADPAPSTPPPPSQVPEPPAAPPASTAPAPAPSSPPTATPSLPATRAPTDDHDDGVVGTSPGSATPAHTGPASTTPPTAGSPADTGYSRNDQRSPPGVTLTGDSWVDLGLALAIASAAALVWRLRSRRYRPRPPSPTLRLDDPDLAPMPNIVTRIRRGLRPRPPTDADPDTGPDDLLDGPVGAADDDRDVADTAANHASGGASVRARPDRPPVVSVDTAPPPLQVPALGKPMLAAWPPAGLGLTGPGAEAAGRGFLAAALAAGGVDDPDARTQVVMPSATAAALLGAAAVQLPHTPRLTVTGSLGQALDLLEEQTQYRTRILYDNEVDTVTQLRDANPFEELLPPVMLIAEAADHERARVAALLVQGQRLDIHGVLLGAWPDGDTVVVAVDGMTTPADGDAARRGAHPADVGRLTVLNPTETIELIVTLAEAHTGLPHPSPRVEAPPPRPVIASPPQRRPAVNDEKATSASPDGASTAIRTGSPVPEHLPEDTSLHAGQADLVAGAVDGDAPASEDAPPDGQDVERRAEGAPPGHVEVVVLGQPQIVNMYTGEPLRPQAMELLVHLIAHDGAASQELILDDILAYAPHSRAPHRLNTYVHNLRRILRLTGGKATYLERSNKRCWLNAEAVGVDLWRLRDALAEARDATDPDVRVAALRRAVGAYRGPLAEGRDYEWVAPYRQAVLQQAIDAHIALADALVDTEPMEAIAVLDTAIGHAPYAEALYVKAMRIHADLGQPDAVRALRRALTRRLAETDTEPADDTVTLADQLVNMAQQRQVRRRRGEGTAA